MNQTKKIIILGIGGNCIDILDTINDINRYLGHGAYDVQGFLDDDPASWETAVCGISVLGSLNSASQYSDTFFVNGIGSVRTFLQTKDIIGKINVPLERFETIIHPTASVSSMAKLGRGVVLLQNVTVTANAKVGNHVIVLPNTVISHDSVIGDCVSIASGVCISGRVKIGDLCYIGSNSSIKEDIEIEEGSLIGMGSVVLENVPDHSTYVGNPAKLLRKTNE